MPEGIVGSTGDAQTALYDQSQQHKQAQRPQQTGLFSNGGKDKVGVRHGNNTGVAHSGAAPKESAVGNRDQRLHNLVGTPAGVQPGVDPGLHAQTHDIEEQVARYSGKPQPQSTQHGNPAPAGCQKDHH